MKIPLFPRNAKERINGMSTLLVYFVRLIAQEFMPCKIGVMSHVISLRTSRRIQQNVTVRIKALLSWITFLPERSSFFFFRRPIMLMKIQSDELRC